MEMVTVVTLMALLVAELLPAARKQRNRMAVVGAREEVAGVFHRARMAAVARGGATITLRALPPQVRLSAGGETLLRADLEREYGIELTLSRNRSVVDLHYDALGIGRVASQTLIVARGGEEVRLVVSSYGRVRRE